MITNETLSRLLSDLGFEPRQMTEKNRRVWSHGESGCTVLLPANRSHEAARPADIVGLRAQLDLHGHIDEEVFDSFLAEGKLPGHSAAQS